MINYLFTATATQIYNGCGERLANDFKRFEQANYRDHYKRCQAEIAQVIQGLGQTAIIFGAGALNDIPVESLAAKFDRIILVDITPSITETALRRFPETLRGKFTITTADVTGILGELSTKVELIAKRELTYDQLVGEVIDLLPTLKRRDFDPKVTPSFVCSSMVASQLGGLIQYYLDTVTKAKYGKRFNGSKEFEQFVLEVQKKHIDDLHRIVDEKGTVYFADHFSARNCAKLTCQGIEKVVAGNQISFPKTNEVQAHLQQRFNQLKRENWLWSLTESSTKLVSNGNEYIAIRQDDITEYTISSLSLRKITS